MALYLRPEGRGWQRWLPVSELVRVQLIISGCLEGPENQALKQFHDHGGQSDWSI